MRISIKSQTKDSNVCFFLYFFEVCNERLKDRRNENRTKRLSGFLYKKTFKLVKLEPKWLRSSKCVERDRDAPVRERPTRSLLGSAVTSPIVAQHIHLGAVVRQDTKLMHVHAQYACVCSLSMFHVIIL